MFFHGNKEYENMRASCNGFSNVHCKKSVHLHRQLADIQFIYSPRYNIKQPLSNNGLRFAVRKKTNIPNDLNESESHPDVYSI